MAQTNISEAARWYQFAPQPPEFRTPANVASWESERQRIRRDLWILLGQLPPRQPPSVKTLVREDRGDYWFEKFEFDNGAGATVPGYLLLPKRSERKGKAPGILYCHWHGGQYDNGKEEIFKSEHTPEAPGPTLVKRGYALIAIDAYCFGERNGKGPGGPDEKGGAGEMTASKFNLWVGRSLWGMILRDDLMALDYLCTRPEVNTNRIGVTGISMGATRSWWLMAVDDRIRAGVAVACLTRYANLIADGGLKYHGIYYYVPGVLQRFDTEAIIAAIAPRPILFMTGDLDSGSPVAGIRKIEASVRPIYRLYAREEAFQNVVYPGVGHVYLPDMWKRMLEWMDRHVARAD